MEPDATREKRTRVDAILEQGFLALLGRGEDKANMARQTFKQNEELAEWVAKVPRQVSPGVVAGTAH